MNTNQSWKPTPEQVRERQLEIDNAAIANFQTMLMARGIWHSCMNCFNWHKVKDNSKGCMKYNAMPPPEVIVVGCKSWEDDIPF